MTDTDSQSQVVQILDRRKHLKQQRRLKFWRGTWRTISTIGLTAGLSWVLAHADWNIRRPSQLKIMGNQQISAQTLEKFMPFGYPTSLMRLHPKAIATTLEKHTHLQQVIVSRQLFPTRLTVEVRERPIVAVTACESCVLIANPDNPDASQLGPANLWFLDSQGIVLPLDSYPALQKSQELPQLSVLNFLTQLSESEAKNIARPANAEDVPIVLIDNQKRSQWRQMYQSLQTSPIEISVIDWQNPKNLVLRTDLGLVHLGPFGDKFGAQLKALDAMRSLPKSVNPSQINYIDLNNPEHPLLEMHQKAPSNPIPKP